MNLLDVNVLVYAFRSDVPQHSASQKFLEQQLLAPEPFGIAEIVLQSVVRVATQMPPQPPMVDPILTFCDRLISSPNCQIVHPTDRHWRLFSELCQSLNLKGAIVADAYLAAFALDRGDDWITADKDFARFPGLRWRRPWDQSVTINPR